MKRATPELRTAAERVLELESVVGKRAPAQLPAAARVSERFRQVLSTLMGGAGFQALLGRAVTLAKADVPELAALQVRADGSLEGLSEHHGKRRFSDGEVILVAHFLQLLLTFLGEALMLRLVNDAWPKVSLGDLDFDKGTDRD